MDCGVPSRTVRSFGYSLPCSAAYVSHAVAMLRMSAIERFCFARCIAVSRFGMAMAARIPTMAMMTGIITMTTMRATGAFETAGFGAPLTGFPQRAQR